MKDIHDNIEWKTHWEIEEEYSPKRIKKEL